MQRETGTFTVKSGLAEMLKGGVIMDVTTAEQAKIAEDAGACAVMALERVPADIRRDGGVARMADATKIEEIQQVVSIPVMAKARIGHFVEAQILQSLGVDYIDESEVLTPADEEFHIDKWAFTVPFVCGARDLGEALRRIAEGAAMIRTKGEAGTGNVVEAVRHQRTMLSQIAEVTQLRPEQYVTKAKELGAPVDLVRIVAEQGRLPVVNFAAGGLATPADAALMMQLGVDGVFVGSGIYKSADPAPRARAIVEATTHFNDPEILAKVSHGLGEPMQGLGDRDAGDASPGPRLVSEPETDQQSPPFSGRGAIVISQAYYYVVAAVGLIFLLGGAIAALIALRKWVFPISEVVPPDPSAGPSDSQRRRALVPRRARLRDPRRARARVASA